MNIATYRLMGVALGPQPPPLDVISVIISIDKLHSCALEPSSPAMHVLIRDKATAGRPFSLCNATKLEVILQPHEPRLESGRRSEPHHPSEGFNCSVQGVTSVSWCKHEASYLLSSGKDGKVMLWDAPQGRALGSFNAGLPGESAHEVKWSPYSPGLFAIATLGGPEGHGKVREGLLPAA